MHDPRRHQRVLLEQPTKDRPGETPFPVAAVQPFPPEAFHQPPQRLQPEIIPRDAVVGIVTLKFLVQLPLLFANRQMPVPAAPVRHRPKRSP